MIGMSVPGSAHGTDEAPPVASSPTLARVFAAWKARQERVKSLHFNWEYRVAFPKGYNFPEAPVVGGLKADGVSIKSDGVHYTLIPGSTVDVNMPATLLGGLAVDDRAKLRDGDRWPW